MQKLALSAFALAAALTAAAAADDRSAARPRPQLRDTLSDAAVRNVSVEAPEADCFRAVWPNIPVRCLSRVPSVEPRRDRLHVAAAEKGGRVAAGPQEAATPPLLFARFPMR
jgi:hypothetical protein